MQELTFDQVEEVSGGFQALTVAASFLEMGVFQVQDNGGSSGTAGFIDNAGGVYPQGQTGQSRSLSGFEKAVLATVTFLGVATVSNVAGGAAATFVGTLASEAKVGGGVHPTAPAFIAP